MLSFPPKDPDEYLDYTLDWSDRLSSDKIVSSTWSTPTVVGSTLATSGVTLATFSLATTTTTFWISGGIEGSAYQTTNHIVTAAGRHMDQSVKLKIKSK